MKDQSFKQLYSFVMLGITIAWACFAVYMTWRALTYLTPIDIIGASGSGVLLGAMINWNGNVNQFWFRKAKPETSDTTSTTTSTTNSTGTPTPG